MTALALPLWLAAGGVVLRGTGFAFRKELTTLRWQRPAGAVFAFSSLVTPFFMGTVVGAIAAGAVPADASRASLVVPSFALLFTLRGRRMLSGGEHGALPDAAVRRSAPPPPTAAHPGRLSPNQHLVTAVRAAVTGVAAVTALTRWLKPH